MNPPMINSTNSVSTTKRKREAERSVNWTMEETQVLLCAWSDERVQKSLAENLRNRHVFKHLSARMSELGFSRSPHQCRLRVKTLKANYVRAKLQRSVDSSQPCSFKYFAEMDAVLGRRSAVMEGGPYFVSPDRLGGPHLDPADRTVGIPPVLNSNTEISSHTFSSLEGAARECQQSWQLASEVKVEDRDCSTDEFEFYNSANSPAPPIDLSIGLPTIPHEIYPKAAPHSEPPDSPENSFLSTPSPRRVVVAPPPPPPQPSASPLPPTPDPSPGALPAPSPGNHHHHHQQQQQHPPESSCLEPALKHLSDCFQKLVSETRGLMVQLEGQRQEQARWHRELLADWLLREERRQRETAEREERREKARMEHEIRVLELLTGLAREQGCRCGGSQTVAGIQTYPNHTISKEDGH